MLKSGEESGYKASTRYVANILLGKNFANLVRSVVLQ